MILKVLPLLLISAAFHASASERLPADVRAFMEKREGCDHMRGELLDSSEAQRLKEVSREIDKLCKGTDRRLAGLKRKYASHRDVMRQLNRFQAQIEASSARATR